MRKYSPYLILLLPFLLLVVFEQDYLYRASEQNLFLHTPMFFRQCMVTSGGLLSWCGAYLTQYFHYPALGAGLLCLLWALLFRLLHAAFRLPRAWLLLALVPVACLLISITDLGYWLFYLKLRGHLFVATLGCLVVASLSWGYLHLPCRHGLRTLLIVFTVSLGYPLFGFYALFAALLMAVLSWRSGGWRWPDALTALLLVVAVPLVFYHTVYHQTNIVNIYWTALPVFCRVGQRYFAYNLPYIFLFASLLLMALCYQQERPLQPLSKPWQWARRALLGAVAVCVAVFWYKDDNFHRELSMMRSLEEQDWEQAVQTSAHVTGEPTRAICLMRNLALARLGRLGDEMFLHPIGARRPNAPFTVRMVDTIGRLVYLQYGVVNYCYRWCMEQGVEYGWSVEKLKLMVKCSLLNGEFQAAQKYLSLLKKSDFQGSWVKKYTELCHHPQLMAQDAELQTIHHMQRPDNFLTADMSLLEKFLIEHFATAQSTDPLFQEQVLVATMMAKNSSMFWRQFYVYTSLHSQQRVPRHYQEAACLMGPLQGADISRMPFDAEVVSSYQAFGQALAQCQQRNLSEEQTRAALYERFHQTYYYDYYFRVRSYE